METLYCTIDAKKIVVSGALREQVSGGASATRYTVIPRRAKEERPVQTGKVLSLDAYRRKVEEREALAEQTEWEEPEETATARPRSGRAQRIGLRLDFIASAAVVCMAIVVAVKFILL